MPSVGCTTRQEVAAADISSESMAGCIARRGLRSLRVRVAVSLVMADSTVSNAGAAAVSTLHLFVGRVRLFSLRVRVAVSLVLADSTI